MPTLPLRSAEEAEHFLNTRVLPDFDLKPGFFRTMMAESGAIIAGSVPLQCLIGERWSHGDMDLYVDTDAQAQKAIVGLRAQGYEIISASRCAYMAIPTIHRVYTLASSRAQIQVIWCDVAATMAAADFAACACTYAPIGIGGKWTHTQPLELLRAKITWPRRALTDYEQRTRIPKYRRRGFTLLAEPPRLLV